MYERTSTIERADGDSVAKTGRVSGILATSGEASDGHILNVHGGDLKRGAPLLFNHDRFDGNLGSWTAFEKSEDAIRGAAQIEMDGVGDKAEWRQDVAHMVDQGHIAAFSLSWEATKPPTRRINLSKDHPAFVDAEKEKDFNKLYGLYFDKWRMLEGSIVTLPADQSALIGRMRDAKSGARSQWCRVLERMAGIPESHANPESAQRILESFDQISLDELEPIELADGRTFYVPGELAEILSSRESESPLDDTGSDIPIDDEGSYAPTEPDEAESLVTARADASASNLERADLFDLLRDEIAPMYQEVRAEWRQLLYEALGRVQR